jgi:hypothetical protein
VTVLVHNKDRQNWAAFLNSAVELGLLYSFLWSRRARSYFIGKDFRAVEDMKKVTHGRVAVVGANHA